MIGQRFYVKIGWISTITSSIECSHGVFDTAAFRENMYHVTEDWSAVYLKGESATHPGYDSAEERRL